MFHGKNQVSRQTSYDQVKKIFLTQLIKTVQGMGLFKQAQFDKYLLLTHLWPQSLHCIHNVKIFVLLCFYFLLPRIVVMVRQY
jgi:hypothetical protein